VEKRYFGTDGIRGRVGVAPITPDFMLRLGWAAGRALRHQNRNKVLIGKDTRISGYMFESALEAGLSAAGLDIALLGPMPTPGVAYLTRTLRASAGIVISASHNAFPDNGLKFFAHDGYKLADAVEHEIEAVLNEPLSTVSPAKLGKAERLVDASGRYIEFCKSTVPSSLTLRGLKLVVDCANGATYHVAPNVFTELGANVIALAVQPDGLNINADCGSTSPAALQAAVIEHHADLGIAFDGDGDRVIMVNHRGELVDGDELLYIIATHRHRMSVGDKAVIGTQMTNMGLEVALAEQDLTLHRVKVGDRYILERLQADHLQLGGESSGHIICLDKNTTGDGIIAALQVLLAMSDLDQSLDGLLNGVQKFPQHMINVPISRTFDVNNCRPVQEAVQAAQLQLGKQGRILLRPSGTEPLIRVMVEGRDLAVVTMLAEELAEIVQRMVRL
jgi:phosphoglucosamine mutase